jgi:hypothetical protein
MLARIVPCRVATCANSTGAYPSDWIHASRCDLDKANGYEFTVDDNLTDANGTLIVGYGYVATQTYPHIMPFYVGSEWADVTVLKDEQVEALWPGVINFTTDDGAGTPSTSKATSSASGTSFHVLWYVLLLVSGTSHFQL